MMHTMIFQVTEEQYRQFTNYLEEQKLTYRQMKDFTPVGRWCLVEVHASTWSVLDKVDAYLNSL